MGRSLDGSRVGADVDESDPVLWTRVSDRLLQGSLRMLPGEHHRMFVLTLLLGATRG